MQQANQPCDNLSIICLQDVSDDDENEEQQDKITICLSSENYQINLDKFCKYSGLVHISFQNKKSIHEIIEDIEEKFPKYHIHNESVKTFFRLLNNEQVQIKTDEYLDLCRLSELFKVRSLKKLLKKYSMNLAENIQFLLNLLINQNTYMNSNSIDRLFSIDIETVLSKHINECLKSDKFKELPIPTIYRIIEKSDRNEIQSDILYDFVMESPKKRLPMLHFVDIKNLSFEKVCELSENDSNQFNSILPNNFKYLKELIESKKRLEEEIKKLKSANEQLETDKKQQDEIIKHLKRGLR